MHLKKSKVMVLLVQRLTKHFRAFMVKCYIPARHCQLVETLWKTVTICRTVRDHNTWLWEKDLFISEISTDPKQKQLSVLPGINPWNSFGSTPGIRPVSPDRMVLLEVEPWVHCQLMSMRTENSYQRHASCSKWTGLILSWFLDSCM